VGEQQAHHKVALAEYACLVADHACLVAAHSLGCHTGLVGQERAPEAWGKALAGCTAHTDPQVQAAAREAEQPCHDHVLLMADQAAAGDLIHADPVDQLALGRHLPALDRSLPALAKG